MEGSTAPLEGDALRIEQLKQKLAQVQHNQALFSLPFLDRTGAGPDFDYNGPSARPRSVYGNGTAPRSMQDEISSTRSMQMADPFQQYSSNNGQYTSSSGNGSTNSLPRTRTAPAIAPALNRSQTARKDPSHFRLLPGSVRQGSNLQENRGVPSSEVVPFLYQDTDTLHSPLHQNFSPTHEISDPLECNPFGGTNPGTFGASSSPLNPNRPPSTGQQLPYSMTAAPRERRDAADINAGSVVMVPPTKKGFFNSFMGKKKRESSSVARSKTFSSPAPEHTGLYTGDTNASPDVSPAQVQNPRQSFHSPSLASLRLPYRRRESLDPKAVRSKRSATSFSQQNADITSAGGITLDTDMSHMSGIVNVDRSASIPGPDFSFHNSRTASITNLPGEEAAWAPPESWAVRRPEDIARDETEMDETDPLDDVTVPISDRKESHISSNTQSSDPSKRGPTHQMRIFRGDWTFATVACGLNTTTESLMTLLGRKFFLRSVANHQILIQRNGLSRILQSWEKPFMIQKTLLEEAGFTADDRIDEIGREDNSYLCRFIFRQCSAPSFSLVSTMMWLY